MRRRRQRFCVDGPTGKDTKRFDVAFVYDMKDSIPDLHHRTRQCDCENSNSYQHNDDFTFELSHSFEEFFLVAVESALDNNRRESAARNEEGMVVFGRIVGRRWSFGRLGHVGIRQLRLYCSMLLFLFIIQLSSHLPIFFSSFLAQSTMPSNKGPK